MNDSDKTRLKEELHKLREKRAQAKHSVNLYLLVIIVALLLALAGATVYFFWKHATILEENRAVSQETQSVNNKYAKCYADLGSAESRANEIEEQFNTSAESRDSLNQLYSNLSNRNAQTEEDLSNTQTSLGSCTGNLRQSESDLADSIDEMNNYITLYNQKKQELSIANVLVTDLRRNVSRSETLRANLQGELEDLRDCVDYYNCTQCGGL